MTKTAQPPNPEDAFWTWIQSAAEGGWIRYHPALARALASDRAAIVLSYAVHLDGRGSGPYSAGRWFYKSLDEWSNELVIPTGAIERVLDLLCIDIHRANQQPRSSRARTTLGLLERWFASRSNATASGVYHYRIAWPTLQTWFSTNCRENGQMAFSQCGRKFHTGMEESSLLDRPLTLDQYGLNLHSSVEDLHQKTSEEDVHLGVGASEQRANDKNWLYTTLTQGCDIGSMTAAKLIDELAHVPTNVINVELNRLSNVRLDQMTGKEPKTIQNWPGLKVSALRSLANQYEVQSCQE